MPHIIVKLYPGKSEQQKRELADDIVKDVMRVLQSPEGAISVAFEEVSAEDWKEDVYLPDIEAKMDTLYKQPGYKL
jgi:4-oxalocrotonate tautomerase